MNLYDRNAVPLHEYRCSGMTLLGEKIKLVLVSMIALTLCLVAGVAGMFAVCVGCLGLKEGSRQADLMFPFLFFGFFGLGLVLSWLFIRRYFQFSLHLYADHLQVRALWFRNSLDVLEVESIRHRQGEANLGGSCEWVEILGAGKSWALYLREAVPDCIEKLRQACPNAIYVDVEGREHLPSRPYDSEKAEVFLIRSRYRRGIMLLGFGLLMAVFATPLAICMALDLFQGQWKEAVRNWKFFLAPLASLAAFVQGWALVKKALAAKKSESR